MHPSWMCACGRLARARQRKPAAARVAAGDTKLQIANSGSIADGSVHHDSAEVAQQAGSAQDTAVTLPQPDAQVAGEHHRLEAENAPEGAATAEQDFKALDVQTSPVPAVDVQSAGAEQHSSPVPAEDPSPQTAKVPEGEVRASMQISLVTRTDTAAEVVATVPVDRAEVVAELAAVEEQRPALRSDAVAGVDGSSAPQAQLAPAEPAPSEVHQEKASVAEAGVAAMSTDIALQAYMSAGPSAKTSFADDEVLTMSLAGRTSELQSTTAVGGGTVKADEGQRLAKLVQETEALRAKMAAAITRIRTLEAEKALAARDLAAASSDLQVPL